MPGGWVGRGGAGARCEKGAMSLAVDGRLRAA